MKKIVSCGTTSSTIIDKRATYYPNQPNNTPPLMSGNHQESPLPTSKYPGTLLPLSGPHEPQLHSHAPHFSPQAPSVLPQAMPILHRRPVVSPAYLLQDSDDEDYSLATSTLCQPVSLPPLPSAFQPVTFAPEHGPQCLRPPNVFEACRSPPLKMKQSSFS